MRSLKSGLLMLAGLMWMGGAAWGADSPHAGMPAGHPNIGGMGATSRPSMTGLLAVRVYQGSKGGPAVGALPITIELYHHGGQLVYKADTRLDAQGAVIVKDVPVDMPAVPEVSVAYNGVNYTGAGRGDGAAEGGAADRSARLRNERSGPGVDGADAARGGEADR